MSLVALKGKGNNINQTAGRRDYDTLVNGEWVPCLDIPPVRSTLETARGTDKTCTAYPVRTSTLNVFELLLHYMDVCVFVYVLLCIISTFSRVSINQSGVVANPARGHLNEGNEFSLSPFAPENLVSRERFGCSIPRQPDNSLQSG